MCFSWFHHCIIFWIWLLRKAPIFLSCKVAYIFWAESISGIKDCVLSRPDLLSQQFMWDPRLKKEQHGLILIRCLHSVAEKMGCCVSTSSRSTCSSKSNGDMVSPSCLEIGCCGQKRTRRTFSDHVISLHHLPSLPSRIFSNGKSRGSCIFTQQGRKGINQDAMIVWEVSMFFLFHVKLRLILEK